MYLYKLKPGGWQVHFKKEKEKKRGHNTILLTGEPVFITITAWHEYPELWPPAIRTT
jgi:hypothetical protein